MNKFTLRILTVAFILTFQLSTIWGQTPAQRNTLLQLSVEFEAAYTQQRTEAIRKADSLGMPVRQEFEDGTIIELQGFKNGRPVYYTTYNLEGAEVIGSADVWSGGEAGFNLSGQGQTLGMWDGGATRLTHQEFTGRVIQADDAVTISDHATHVAATMVAAGTVAAAKGMSYQANLDAYDWNNDDAQMAAAAANGLNVSQHSYGNITGWRYNNSGGVWEWWGEPTISETEDYRFGFYNERARNWDIIANNAPHYLIVKSAGNDRGNGPEPGTGHYVWIDGSWEWSTAVRDKDGGADGYDCISTNGTAKNIMSVGAVTAAGAMSSFSSWGPTDDGRIKPDIVAKGVGVYSALGNADDAYATWQGTSMSGPMVSGSVGLLLEHWENLHGADNPMLSSTVKGLIIHTASQLDNPGPDYRNGWGMMNTRAAVELMAENAQAGAEFNIRELTLNQGQTMEITVTADGSGPLVATFAWNDPAGTPPSASLNPTDPMLVNDLDLRVADASTTWQPWILDPANPSLAATTGDNFRDNVEQVFIENPTPGETYTITITHKNTLAGGSQDFSLIISGIGSYEIPDPIVGDVNSDGKLNILDVTMLINYIIGNNPDGFNADLADVNEDGEINVADVTALINLILYGNTEGNGKDYPESSPALLSYDDDIIRLQSDGTLAALYLEYYLSKEEEVAVVLLQEGLQLTYSQHGNLVKAVVFSMGNTAIPAGEIPLIHPGKNDHFATWGKALASNTMAQAVNVETQMATSVFTDDPNLNQLQVYPNPSHGEFFVQFTLPSAAEVDIQLFDLTGRGVLQHPASVYEAGSHALNVSADHLKRGIYLLQVRSMDPTTRSPRQTWYGKVRIE